MRHRRLSQIWSNLLSGRAMYLGVSLSYSRYAITAAALISIQFGTAIVCADEPVPRANTDESRVNPIPIEQMAEQQKRLLGIVDGAPLPRRAKSNLMRTLMHHPELMTLYFPLGDRVARAAEFSNRDRELVILRIAWLYQGEYEWRPHYRNALEAGWTEQEIERIKHGPNAAGWKSNEKALLSAADQLVRNASLDDDTWAALREDYSVQDIMILFTLVTHYHWAAMMTNSLGVEPDGPVYGFEPLPSGAVQESTLEHEGFVAFVEGPAWRSDGSVFFTDVPNNKILRRTAKGKVLEHRSPSGHANGLFIDGLDRLLIAEMDGRIVRENLDGAVEVLADNYNGMALNGPNDLALDSKGRIYFTDPVSLRPAQSSSDSAAPPKTNGGVYRIGESGGVSKLIGPEIDRPNGIFVSPGDQYLYVADNDPRAGGARRVWRFNLDEAGNVDIESKRLLFDWGTDRRPDGMTVDSSGRIYVASGLNHPQPNRTSLVYKAGIYVLSPDGELLDVIAIPMDNVSNVTFGGDDRKTLFITAGHSLWSYKVDTAGYTPF